MNRAPELLRTLSQLSALPEQPQIVVVDNGSTDATARAVRQRFPEVELVCLRSNHGAAARNVGLSQLNTRYVALCDDDCWYAPGAISHAAALLSAHPKLGVVVGRVLVGATEREDRMCAHMADCSIPNPQRWPGQPVVGFLAGASVVRREALLDVGGFEPRFLVGGEEELVAYDLLRTGWGITYVPDVVVHHYPSRVRDQRHRRHYLERNRLWTALMRRSTRHACREAASLARRAVHDSEARAVLAAAVTGLPWALSQRRPLPRHLEDQLRDIERQRTAERHDS